MKLHGKTALVTGATGGIGEAIARAMADEGVRLALIARRTEPLAALAADLQNRGCEAAAFPCDIRSSKEIEAVVQDVHTRFGAIDILVNSAFWGPPGSLEETTEEFWDHTMDTCLKAPYLFARAVAPFMKSQGAGRIVNIGSMAGKIGEDNRTAYCAAKWGLEGLNAALSIELLKDNIHVHLISPAATRTGWWPSVGAELTDQVVERMIPPESVAGAVIWAISQPDQVHIPDVPVYNFRNPFEGKGSPFES